MLLANKIEETSARMTGTKVSARVLSEGLSNNKGNVLSSIQLNERQKEAMQGRASTQIQDASQKTLSAQNLSLGKCDREQGGAALQNRPFDAQGKIQEMEKRGIAKPSYRGVRQRPWGEIAFRNMAIKSGL